MGATITITGNLAQSPAVETVEVNGEDRELCRLNIGYTINRGHNDGNFIEVTTWGEAAANHARYLTKGSPVRVDGELSYETWQAGDGTNRSRHRVINAHIEYLADPSPRASHEPATVGSNRT